MNFTVKHKFRFNHAFSSEHRIDVNARKTDGWTPLHVASFFGRLEIVRALLDFGASTNAENIYGETPLFLVSRGEYASQDDGACIARLLLERGSDANARRKDHWTALHVSSHLARHEIMRILLDHGANPKAKNRQGKDSLNLVSRGEYGSEEDGVQVARLLLERGVDVRSSDREHWTPLHSASFSGKSEIARLLLDHGAKVDAENDDGETPLTLVSRGEYRSQSNGVRIAQLLLERGADVNGQPEGDWTPLSLASFKGRKDIVRVLVDHGAIVNKESKFCGNPLHAVSQGEYESQEDGAAIAQILLDHGADANAPGINHVTPLLLATSSGRIEIVRALLSHGAIANTETYDGENPLHLISQRKDGSQDAIRLTQLLVEHGVDVNAPDKDRDTPLHSACFSGKLDIALELLRNGATATAMNGGGETPLHVISRGEFESQDGAHLARLLLEHGADVNAADNDGDTPIHSACCQGKLGIAQELLNLGAAANVMNTLGETPLHVVSTDGVHVAQLLLEHGVDVNIPDKHNRTPLGAASCHGSLEISRLLLDHGAAVNARDDFGCTPLHLTSLFSGSSEELGLAVARLLLERGADIHAQDTNHMTPLDLSSRRGWSNMAQVLSEHGAIFFSIYLCEW